MTESEITTELLAAVKAGPLPLAQWAGNNTSRIRYVVRQATDRGMKPLTGDGSIPERFALAKHLYDTILQKAKEVGTPVPSSAGVDVPGLLKIGFQYFQPQDMARLERGINAMLKDVLYWEHLKAERTSKLTPKEAVTWLEALPGVVGAKLWNKSGKSRIYIETVKKNGGANWNGGVGYNGMYVDLDAKRLVEGTCAGAATRDWHQEKGTIESIESIVSAL